MPTQTIGSDTPEYAVNDTGPPLVNTLCDGAGDPIDLTGAAVVINIAYASYSYYYSPQLRLVDGGACVVDPDQTEGGNRGKVSFAPGVAQFNLAGTYRYNYEVTYPDATRQTIAPNSNNTLIIRAPAGGNQYA
jgi:hypothetical protein